MNAKIETKTLTTFTLVMTEQEYEDLYEFIEVNATEADGSAYSQEQALRAIAMLEALPQPPSRDIPF
jgi:hypothetical protein